MNKRALLKKSETAGLHYNWGERNGGVRGGFRFEQGENRIRSGFSKPAPKTFSIEQNKRAELTSSQIATLILTIAGFVIALVFLLVFLDTKSMTRDEICHLSILARATAPDSLQRLAPLKCSIKKVCLSPSGNSDCTDNQFIGEDKSKIDKESVSNPEDLEKTVADAMLDCWSMTGEGKLDVFGGGGDHGILNLINLDAVFRKKTVCLICSRLSIDDIPKETLDQVDVTSFMETNRPQNSELTYLNLLTDRQVRSFPREFRGNLSEERNKNKGTTDEIAIIFMQIDTNEDELENAFGAAQGAGAFAFISTSGVGPLGILNLKEAAIFSAFAATTAGTVAYFQTWASKDLAAAHCGELTSIDDQSKRRGCSVVMPVDYKDIEFINKHCSIIEGQP